MTILDFPENVVELGNGIWFYFNPKAQQITFSVGREPLEAELGLTMTLDKAAITKLNAELEKIAQNNFIKNNFPV